MKTILSILASFIIIGSTIALAKDKPTHSYERLNLAAWDRPTCLAACRDQYSTDINYHCKNKRGASNYKDCQTVYYNKLVKCKNSCPK